MDNSSLQHKDALNHAPTSQLPSSAMCCETGGHGAHYRPPQDEAQGASALWNGAGREEGRVTVVLALSGVNSHQSLPAKRNVPLGITWCEHANLGSGCFLADYIRVVKSLQLFLAKGLEEL